mgnify:CR=1 FL=1
MRPAREVFVHDLKIVFVIEFVGRKDAEFVPGFEQGDGNHEDAGKRKCVALGECKILCHVRNLRTERADPARWLLERTRTGRDHRAGEDKRRQLASRPR